LKGAAAPAPRRPPALAGELEIHRLDNGLRLATLVNRQAPIVSSAIFFGVGARDEPPGRGGLAHFLEHLMFKGSERYGPGEIDRLTQALGGTNNAFTGHDVTAFWFSFAADRWTEALEIEADRLRGLTLDSAEVDAERRVIVEEIAMYRDDPWDALELDVLAALHSGHPYALSILGTERELEGETPEVLREFHRRWYVPGNATLVVAGDLGGDVVERVEAAMGALSGAAPGRPSPGPPRPQAGEVRIERRHGEVARLLLALPAPPPDHPEHGPLRLAATLLAGGRSSRLQRRLVDEEELCLSVTAAVSDEQLGAAFTVAAELLPGSPPDEVERIVRAELGRLAAEAPAEAELERARAVFLADWAYEQERIHQQAVVVGLALALFDPGQPARLLEAALAAAPADLCAVAARRLDPAAGSVTGLSLPES
jgi:zinc protease